ASSNSNHFAFEVDTIVGAAPDDIGLAPSHVPENSIDGTVVGTLSSHDPDSGDTATFTLVDDAGGLFALSGNDIVVNGALDHEQADQQQITVRVTDSDNNFREETFIIAIDNVLGVNIKGSTKNDKI